MYQILMIFETVYVSISDLNYQGGTTSKEVTRAEFWRMKKFDGRYLRQRITQAQHEAIQRDIARDAYDKAIQKKYNVGPGWRNNQWFVEQVRPTLYGY